MTDNVKKVCLVVIDGWGDNKDTHGNAIHYAVTPYMDKLVAGNNIWLEASEENVGIPAGQMGNSEVGHLNIGSGRVAKQDIVVINDCVKQNGFIKNEVFVDACKNATSNSSSRLHLLGLISDGGVHSHINHLLAMIKAAKELGVQHCFIHFFSDGRDTSPESGVTYVQQLLDYIQSLGGYGTLATVVGRYYAMDRDKRWERIKIAYDALTVGSGHECNLDQLIPYIKSRYKEKETDEFLKPICLSKEGLIVDRDTLIFFDYRSDRMRQITSSFGIELHFDPIKTVKNLKIYTMTQYNAEFNKYFKVLFPPLTMNNVLAEWISKQGLKQLHVAETEKYPHVTFFFNGGREIQFEGEERALVPSPKVATYDLKPEMSADGVATEVVNGIESGKYAFVMCNFAPPDMVGHTGKYEPTIAACTETDRCIGRIVETCRKHNYIFMVTADHGNAEQMYMTGTTDPRTAHTMFPVPFANDNGIELKAPSDRLPALCDVAPTILEVMNLPVPPEMTGVSLLKK